MAFVVYQSEDGTIEDTVRCGLDDKPKFIVRQGKRLYPALCGQQKTPNRGSHWQLSSSNGFVGTSAELKKQMEQDRLAGVPIQYVKVQEKVNGRGNRVGVYKAAFGSANEKRRYLRAFRRVDFDAGYGDPCPGDFAGQIHPDSWHPMMGAEGP